MAVKQTAGRDALGEFAPKFAELNDVRWQGPQAESVVRIGHVNLCEYPEKGRFLPTGCPV